MDDPVTDGRGRNLTQEQRRQISKAGGAASAGKLSHEERKQKALHAAAARELKRELKKSFGEGDTRGPEQRKATAAAGGRARMAKLSPAERKEWADRGREKSLEVLAIQRDALGTLGRDRYVTLPISSARGKRHCFLKLIRQITDEPLGFGWKGTILKPGATVTQATLRPSKDWPPRPLIVESGGICGPRGEVAWFLWTLRGSVFVELAHCQCRTAEWAVAFRPFAEQVLAEAPPTQSEDYLLKRWQWMQTWLDRRIAETPKEDRLTLIGWTSDYCSSRAVAEMPNRPDVAFEATAPDVR